jgi:hypothetical protein
MQKAKCAEYSARLFLQDTDVIGIQKEFHEPESIRFSDGSAVSQHFGVTAIMSNIR